MVRDGQSVVRILRDKIISGEFSAGERLAEIPTADRLGISRTPVRIAFRALAQEGLLEKLPRRGYQVRNLSAVQIGDSIEVRGVLEGLAARQAAEKSLDQRCREAMQTCLAAGDLLFENGALVEDDIEKYHNMNMRFHDLIITASGNDAVKAALALSEHLPFASVSALAFNPQQLDREYRRLHYAHMQHHAIYHALINGQGARAEALMKEHAHATLAYSDLFDKNTSNTVLQKAERTALE
ncbi:MAG: GntR family transcriptional regulator [Paraglaciecola sp.]|uniref:GntR family transcriptional regulator n=1 Tax=Paraglaciecola sp. TaxID=1920173 RepID=UPI00273FBBF6|nr:GntR family transcriptional regulator [Paraglaciecola sp.]MDP5029178.1 GntR family transcriptional regulator [Paraglaciecola sp.]MDP5129369.1 GntR family transcriptional regulator [Paraglaciecola sp.]